MPDVFTGQEFAKRLSTGQLKRSIVKIGMAKKSDDSLDTILFAEGRMCDEWISIPVSMIEQVTFLGNVTCRDHQHPLVVIQFKEPDASNETARVFADLARQGPRTQPTQSSKVARRPSRGAGECIDGCVEHFERCANSGGDISWCIELLGYCFQFCSIVWESSPENRQ
jgi:hypothetical protein